MSNKAPHMLVIIPALNEEATIRDVVKAIPQSIPGIASLKVLVVDDGSTDETAPRARAAGAEIIAHSHNRGVGAAMQTGLREAVRRGADFVVNIDGDGQFDPKDIPKVLRPIMDGSADFATASRFKNSDLVPKMPLIKRSCGSPSPGSLPTPMK
jgi:glycosyltransferase involved in cell wall biosynthesis